MRKITLLVALAAVLVLISVAAVAAQDASAGAAFVRFAHYAKGTNALDGRINGEVNDKAVGLKYLQTSEWVRVPAGGYRLAMGPTGTGDSPYSLITSLQPGTWTTIATVRNPGGRPGLTRINEVARVRVAHLAISTGSVDVFVNGELSALTGVGFGTVSDWIEVPAGPSQFGIAPAGAGEAVSTISAGLQGGSWSTIVAVRSNDGRRPTLRRIVEDYSPLTEGLTRVTLFHAIPAVGPIDVSANGRTLVRLLAYPGDLGDNDGAAQFTLGAGTYNFSISSSFLTSPLLTLDNRVLQQSRGYFIAAIGSTTNPQIVLKSSEVPMP